MDTFQDLIDAAESKVGDFAGSPIFLDEPQNIPERERAVSTLHVRGADVYTAGSNSVMLSSELATKLSGRRLEIRIRPLMFSEYFLSRGSEDRAALLEDYLRHGGFPAAAPAMDRMPAQVGDILDGIMENVVYNELVCRFGDVAVCSVGRYKVDFIADPVGSPGLSIPSDPGRTYFRAVVRIHPDFTTDAVAASDGLEDRTGALLESRGCLSMSSICEGLGLKHPNKRIRDAVMAMMDDGRVAYLYPESPRSPKQRTCLVKEKPRPAAHHALCV